MHKYKCSLNYHATPDLRNSECNSLFLKQLFSINRIRLNFIHKLNRFLIPETTLNGFWKKFVHTYGPYLPKHSRPFFVRFLFVVRRTQFGQELFFGQEDFDYLAS